MVLHDPQLATINDLGANFYLNESHVGKVSRADACFGQLQELNSYVKVAVSKDSIGQEFLKNFDVVVFTENYDQKFLEDVDAFCRSQNIGFIYAG